MRITRKRGGVKPELSKYPATGTTRNFTKPKTGKKSLTMKQQQRLQKRRELVDALQKEKNKCVVLYTKVLNQLEELLEKGEAEAYDVSREVYDKIHLYKGTLRSVVPRLFPDELPFEDTMDYLQEITDVMRKSIPLQRLSATIANAVIGATSKKEETVAIEKPSADMLELEQLLGDLTIKK